MQRVEIMFTSNARSCRKKHPEQGCTDSRRYEAEGEARLRDCVSLSFLLSMNHLFFDDDSAANPILRPHNHDWIGENRDGILETKTPLAPMRDLNCCEILVRLHLLLLFASASHPSCPNDYSKMSLVTSQTQLAHKFTHEARPSYPNPSIDCSRQRRLLFSHPPSPKT